MDSNKFFIIAGILFLVSATYLIN